MKSIKDGGRKGKTAIHHRDKEEGKGRRGKGKTKGGSATNDHPNEMRSLGTPGAQLLAHSSLTMTPG